MSRRQAGVAALVALFVVGLAVAYGVSQSKQTVTVTTTVTHTVRARALVAALVVTPTGSDANACTQAAPCASFDAAYQKARPGDAVSVAPGSYPTQVITPRADLRNLSPGCSTAAPAQCVHFVGTGVRINGVVEIHGADFWLDGGTDLTQPGFYVTGYIDTEANADVYPDHVIVQGTHSSSFGVFNANTVTYRWMDIGPATIHWYPTPVPGGTCGLIQGPGIENKIGFAGGSTVVPTNVTLDGLVIHDQNGDDSRLSAPSGNDCHFGGLFLVTANGLTIINTIFQGNVVYHIQIQNFGGAPPATNVLIAANTFGCAVDWLYRGAGCTGQSAIQFDYAAPGFTITGNNTSGGLVGCLVGTCGNPPFSGDDISNNTQFPQSPTAPPLPSGGGGTTTGTTTTTTTTTATTTSGTTTTGTSTTTPTTTSTSTVVSEIGLRDKAVSSLKQTTVGYINKSWQTPPSGSQWATGLGFLITINADQNWRLRAAAVNELKLTTVGFINKKWKTPPAGTHWANALKDLAAIT